MLHCCHGFRICAVPPPPHVPRASPTNLSHHTLSLCLFLPLSEWDINCGERTEIPSPTSQNPQPTHNAMMTTTTTPPPTTTRKHNTFLSLVRHTRERARLYSSDTCTRAIASAARHEFAGAAVPLAGALLFMCVRCFVCMHASALGWRLFSLCVQTTSNANNVNNATAVRFECRPVGC